METKSLKLMDIFIENLHSTKESFIGQDKKEVVFYRNVCLIPSLGENAFELTSKESLPKGRIKATVTVSAKKDGSLKLSAQQSGEKKSA